MARLLVRHLIPAVAPDARGFDDIAASVFDYGMLDREDGGVRLRLNSTAVGVREVGNDRVQVDYVRNGDALSVTGGHCVLACYNAAIPHLCPELPESQKEALRYGVKIPLVLTNVLLRKRSCLFEARSELRELPQGSIRGGDHRSAHDDWRLSTSGWAG